MADTLTLTDIGEGVVHVGKTGQALLALRCRILNNRSDLFGTERCLLLGICASQRRRSGVNVKRWDLQG